MPGSPSAANDPALVLGKALVRAGSRLGFSQQELAAVVGSSAATLSRVASGARGFDPATKEGELALLLVRVYRSLDALVGGDDAAARAWLEAQNDALGGAPRALLSRVEGLVHVALYLDAMRGRL